MMSTFESLPTEIQQVIFNNLSSSEASDMLECILVCKSWKGLFLNPLYSHAFIYSYKSSARFLRTLKKNQYLRGLVKELTLSFEMDGENQKKNLTIAKLFAYLPKVECVDFSDSFFMKNLLHALVFRYLPKLNDIRVVSLKSEEIEYNTCAMLIKDRLKNVWINEVQEEEEEEEFVEEEDEEEEEERVDMYTDDESDDGYDEEHELSETEECFREVTDDEITDDEEQDEEEIRIEKIIRQYIGCEKVFQLFDKLDQFKNIKILTIEKKPENIINLMETVTRNCAHLQQLHIYFDSSSKNDGFKSVDLNKIHVSNSVSHLSLNRYACNDPQLIHYIMRKFPKLKKLELPVVTELDETTFNDFLNYLSNIESIAAPDIFCKQQTLINCLTSFWNATLRSRNLLFEVQYNRSYYEREERKVEIQTGLSFNKISYSPSKKDEDIIDKYSSYIKNLTLSGLKPTSLYSSLIDVRKMDYEVLQPLKDCTKLKRFTILGCMLTEKNVSGYEFFRKQEAFHFLRLIRRLQY